MLPKHRPPTHPGTMLLHQFLEPQGLSQVDLAKRLKISVQRVNELVNGKRGVTAETAVLLAKAFDMSPQFWMNLQSNYDIWHAQRRMASAR